jgi:hypothetical protein
MAFSPDSPQPDHNANNSKFDASVIGIMGKLKIIHSLSFLRKQKSMGLLLP